MKLVGKKEKLITFQCSVVFPMGKIKYFKYNDADWMDPDMESLKENLIHFYSTLDHFSVH